MDYGMDRDGLWNAGRWALLSDLLDDRNCGLTDNGVTAAGWGDGRWGDDGTTFGTMPGYNVNSCYDILQYIVCYCSDNAAPAKRELNEPIKPPPLQKQIRPVIRRDMPCHAMPADSSSYQGNMQLVCG